MVQNQTLGDNFLYLLIEFNMLSLTTNRKRKNYHVNITILAKSDLPDVHHFLPLIT